MLVVLTTTPNIEEAENLARKIIEEKLAACVQVLPPMKSFYFWENTVQSESEHLLLIKTIEEKFKELENLIRANHSY
ncbi:MAG: divalent-cation tolerance protein CutA, partial [Acidobacteria bacterium]|nr:divalent-cation tolerance protein CutA [Acidobacteriota bacterium]MCA1638508.1 divalent-cation tolerance protein CutA [Acidobacteriota bacterium]